MRLALEVPEEGLLAEGKHPWLAGHPLIAVLHGTLHHHIDHLRALRTWIDEHRR